MPVETQYTTAQLQILHKLTLYKYHQEEKHLITLEEYNELGPFLKGYAFVLQAGNEKSPIPKNVIKNVDFHKGMEQAESEIQLFE